MINQSNTIASPQQNNNNLNAPNAENVVINQNITQNQTNVMQVSNTAVASTVVVDNDDGLFYCKCIFGIIFFVFVIIGAFFYFLFLICKFLVLSMIVDGKIYLFRPVRDRIAYPVLDLTLRVLYALSDKIDRFNEPIQNNFVTLFFFRVLFCLLFDLGVFLFLQITHTLIIYLIVFICIFTVIVIIMVIAVIMNFCARTGLQSTCKCLDSVHGFDTLFFQFKFFSFCLSVTLFANQIAYSQSAGPNAVHAAFTIITFFDIFLDVLCFIAMVMQSSKSKNRRRTINVDPTPQQPQISMVSQPVFNAQPPPPGPPPPPSGPYGPQPGQAGPYGPPPPNYTPQSNPNAPPSYDQVQQEQMKRY